MTRKLGLAVAVVLALVAFIAFNVVSGRMLRSARLDVTENKQFTLAAGSRAIARSPAEPVTLRFYHTPELAQGQAALETYGKRVREMLEEYARESEGKVRLEIINPKADTPEEDAAVAAGLTGVPAGPGGESFYFGLVGTNTIDTREVIAFFDPAKEEFLEYDLSKLLSSLANPKKPTVGWISNLQLEGGFTINPQTRQPSPTRQWAVFDEIKQLYTVKKIESTVAEIPSDVDVLMVVHPKGLSEGTQYAIDQFVLRGGRLMLFVDPLCEMDTADQFADASQKASELPRLLNAWGVEVPNDQLAADQDMALRVMVGSRNAPEQVPFVLWLEAKGDSLAKEDVVTGQVKNVNFASAGVLREIAESKSSVAVTPLVTTTARGTTINSSTLGMQPDPKKMFAEFVPGAERLTLAARLSGKAQTAFADGPPKNPDGQPVVDAAKHLTEGEINVLVFTDADVLADRMWMQETNFLGMRGIRKLADNSDMTLAAVDNFAGSSDLIAVRARQKAARPFTRVQEIQRAAEQKYQKEEVALNTKLQETQQRLNELQSQQGDAATGGLVLTPEQQAEVDKFRQEMVSTRAELRNVRRGLREDIEKLDATMRFVNIAAMPLGVIGAALLIWGIRSVRRRG